MPTGSLAGVGVSNVRNNVRGANSVPLVCRIDGAPHKDPCH
jgi:hypothetical protein